MKTIIKVVAACLILSPLTTLADDESTGPYISLGYNWFNFDDIRPIDDADDFNFAVGFQTTNNIGFEIRRTNADFSYTNASLVYRYNPRNQSSFFWKAGVGRYSDLVTGESNVSFGAGYEHNFGNNLSLNFGLEGLKQFSNGGALDWVPFVGVNYFFGEASKKAAAPKVVQPDDSDKDGVNDSNDQCPNTVVGVMVDANGCELDSDKDGVVDRLDQCPKTPMGAKVDEKGCRIILTEDVSIRLQVQFGNDSNQISNDYHDEIKKVADFMKAYPDTKVVIEGHTDSRGAESYNQRLSQKRAEAVMAYIVSQFGVEQSRISAIGKGELSPVADNATAEGRAQNRRVQAEIKTSVSKPQ